MSTMPGCPVCGSERSEEFFRNETTFNPYGGRSRALSIAVCPDCGMVFQNSAYEPGYDEYIADTYSNYDSKELFDFPRRSPANIFAADMVAGHLKGRKFPDVLEIGSNKGDFLYMVKELVPTANILGFEPSSASGGNIPTIHGFFNPASLASQFDAILLKQVLEHFKNPKALLRDVASLLDEDGFIYLDVPNVDRILEGRTDGFILEHVLYFNENTLERVLPEGWTIVHVESGASVCAVCKKSVVKKGVETGNRPNIAQQMHAFATSRSELIDYTLKHCSEIGDVVFYGCYNYFRGLFRELESRLDSKRCYYYDDNFKGEHEPVFGLPRRKEFKNTDLIILCSNNDETLNSMFAKAMRMEGRVLKPWDGLYDTSSNKRLL